MQMEYILDYTLWQFLRNQDRIEYLKKTLDEYYLEDDRDYLFCLKYKG